MNAALLKIVPRFLLVIFRLAHPFLRSKSPTIILQKRKRQHKNSPRKIHDNLSEKHCNNSLRNFIFFALALSICNSGFSNAYFRLFSCDVEANYESAISGLEIWVKYPFIPEVSYGFLSFTISPGRHILRESKFMMTAKISKIPKENDVTEIKVESQGTPYGDFRIETFGINIQDSFVAYVFAEGHTPKNFNVTCIADDSN